MNCPKLALSQSMFLQIGQMAYNRLRAVIPQSLREFLRTLKGQAFQAGITTLFCEELFQGQDNDYLLSTTPESWGKRALLGRFCIY